MRKLMTIMCFLVCASLSAQTLEVSRDKNDNVILVDQSGATVSGPYVSAEFNQKFNVWTVKTSNGKFGMLSDSGKELLPAKYSFFGEISDDGIFWINTGGKDLDTQKSIQKYFTSHMSEFSKKEKDPEKLLKERERIEDSYCHGMVDIYGTKVVSGKFGYADCTGKIILDAKYNLVATGFSEEGLAWYMRGSKYGVIDNSGKIILTPTYRRIDDYHNSLAIVYGKKYKYGYINTSGELVTPDIFTAAGNADNVIPWVKGVPAKVPAGCYSEYAQQASVGQGYGMEEKHAMVGPDGKLLSPLKYDYIGELQDGMSYCGYDDCVTFVNSEGREILPAIFKKAWNFKDGLAVASLPFRAGVGEINTRSVRGDMEYFGVIDKQGRVVVPFVYSEYKGRSEGTFLFEDSSGAVWLDNDGNRLYENHNFSKAHVFVDSIAPVSINGRWGYMDREGNVIVECMYENEALKFVDGYAWVCLSGKYGAIDKNGTVVVPILLDSYEDAMTLCNTVLKENGGIPLGIRQVEIFGKKKLNQKVRFKISETIPEDNWDF